MGRAPLSDFILALPILVFSVVAHEYAHGYAALKQGDDTALVAGRLTLNPIPHIDPLFTLIMPALLWYVSEGRFIFGGAKPVPVRPDRFRNYVRGDIIVSLAGILTNLAIMLGCAGLFVGVGMLARAIPGGSDIFGTAQRMLFWGVVLNLMLAFFNLIPLPPLDGSHVVYHILPQGLRERYRAFQRLGFLPLMLIMFVFPRVIQVLLTPAYAGVALFLRLASPYAVGTNWNIFPS
ncbi:MAG TPA: site-2 protease family protein [Gemmatimonadales bacterium]|nr:site-2 protease family protein [Gemmatimonadales bacterium]